MRETRSEDNTWSESHNGPPVKVHARASSFSAVADEYERARPGYPIGAAEWMVGDARRVVDLAAGTGKLTEVLVRPGREVIALEPLPEMLARLRARLSQVHAVRARAEALPLGRGSCDAVTAAQAFHWFDAARAVAEIARVLAPGGTLGAVWNLRDDAVEWVAELSQVIGSERVRNDWLEQVEASSYFEPPQRRLFRHEQVLDRDGLSALVRSRSYVATMEEGERERVLEAVEQLCRTHPQLAGRDRIVLPYVTETYRIRRT